MSSDASLLTLVQLSAGGWLEDVSLVTKYEISEEAYNARKNTYRKFKEEKLKEDPEWSLKKEIDARKAKAGMEPSSDSKSKIEDDEYMATEASAIKVGDRCEVAGGRRGCVKYVGKIPELPKGWWVGVQYDEPVGKNDGSVKGVSYFECLDKYGGFVRPDLVQVGDFPELDPFADLEDEI
uniref:CAP-Gly domain-containing protein n=1 Tax=Guillardia theta TaxID=55529 RepID=A0A7S4PKF1_GUITH|mmetsp:Transcript_5503/g.19371  ORF Transcript_5503/g.19371 Transcript_5503/m.19371 type:complete len:180 (+) Transcript_5503:449-988(+)